MNANFGTRFRCRGGCGEKLMVIGEGDYYSKRFPRGWNDSSGILYYLDVSFSCLGGYGEEREEIDGKINRERSID